MSDREAAFIERWHREAAMYEAFGHMVVACIEEGVAAALHGENLAHFFKVPVTTRLKEEPSLLTKAFHRNKPYSDPYVEIEDKVGVRAVVLFTGDIRLVEHVVNQCRSWTAKKARDFEDERKGNPYHFDYQSLHYVVNAGPHCSYLGTAIGEGIPCEIQIRTLLQHAYSELTHDTIYKPNVTAQPEVKRAAAKSMALIEATDDYFTQVRSLLVEASAPGRAVTEAVLGVYEGRLAGTSAIGPLNDLLIDHYEGMGGKVTRKELEEFFDDRPYLLNSIAERAPSRLLYRQPAILLVYWAVAHARYAAAAPGGPLGEDELDPIYSDLGESIPR